MLRGLVVVFVFLALAGSAGGYRWYTDSQAAAAAAAVPSYKTPHEENVLVRFDMEIYDIVQKEYWGKLSDVDLAELFRLSVAKAEGIPEEVLPDHSREGTAKMLATVFEKTAEDKRKQLAVDIGTVVLANLAPQGRSGLLTEKEQQNFRDTANNIDRSKDLYASLDLTSGASIPEVEKAFEEKKDALAKDTSDAGKLALKDAEYARKVLADEGNKAIYDTTKIEPSLVSRIIGGKNLYINMSQVTPATFNEFMNTLQKTKDNPELTGLILDVRSNIGGALDFARFLLALFIGPNQYAFDLFRQGELQVERTPADVARIDSLKNFKEIAILTDTMTQSTAELTAAMFQRLNMGKVVGTKTRGWGSVENTYPVTTSIAEGEKYTVLLVNSLTLREDNEPIESNGVTPDVDTTQKDWRQRLSTEFRSPSLIEAIRGLMSQ